MFTPDADASGWICRDPATHVNDHFLQGQATKLLAAVSYTHIYTGFHIYRWMLLVDYYTRIMLYISAIHEQNVYAIWIHSLLWHSIIAWCKKPWFVWQIQKYQSPHILSMSSKSYSPRHVSFLASTDQTIDHDPGVCRHQHKKTCPQSRIAESIDSKVAHCRAPMDVISCFIGHTQVAMLSTTFRATCTGRE